MSDDFYTEMQNVASEVLGEFKQGVITLTQSTPGAGPADNPGAPTTVTHTLDAVVKGASFKYVSMGLALASDMIVTAAVIAGVTPKKDDVITIDGKKYKVVQDVSAPAAGTRAVWKLIVRK